MSNIYGSLEVYFEYSPADELSVQLLTDILCIPAYQPVSIGLAAVTVNIASEEHDGSTWIICQTLHGVNIVDQADFSMDCPELSLFQIRVFFGEKYLAVYCNSKMVYTYAFADIHYTRPTTASLKAIGGEIEFSNIRNVELSDRREAVYVDYEATAESAIQSIIQQRPVQIFAAVDRILAFTYAAIKDEVQAHNVSEYTETTRDNPQMSSDGLVYYADVSVSISEQTAEEVGLITRLYRLSDLDTGAAEAAAVYQEKALEKRTMITIIMRLDPRIEITDNMLVDLILTGTERQIEDDIIIEDIQVSLEDGRYTLRLMARRNL